MKLILQTQLSPDRNQSQKLSAMMEAFNAAADLGVENIADDSDGNQASGADVEHFRQKNYKQRRALHKAAKIKAKGYRPKSI